MAGVGVESRPRVGDAYFEGAGFGGSGVWSAGRRGVNGYVGCGEGRGGGCGHVGLMGGGGGGGGGGCCWFGHEADVLELGSVEDGYGSVGVADEDVVGHRDEVVD